MNNNVVNKKAITSHEDIEDIVARFYATMLQDPIVGYIFTDVAKIDLQQHLPIIADFWSSIVFKQKQYSNNVLAKHLELNQTIALTPGHFTRWLYLFNRAIDEQYIGSNAQLMKDRAESVAKTISAAISDRKKQGMNLVLPSEPN